MAGTKKSKSRRKRVPTTPSLAEKAGNADVPNPSHGTNTPTLSAKFTVSVAEHPPPLPPFHTIHASSAEPTASLEDQVGDIVAGSALAYASDETLMPVPDDVRSRAPPAQPALAAQHSDGGPVGGTARKASVGGLLMADHTLDSVRGYVIQDLEDAVPTTIEKWVDLFLGMDLATSERWTAKIVNQRWFFDDTIQTALVGYCTAKAEKDCYRPFIELVTSILEKARTTLGLAGSWNSYPVSDVHLVNNATRPTKTIPEHGKRGAERGPDIVLVRKGSISEGENIRWTDVLTWFEVKVENLLVNNLSKALVKRGLALLDGADE